MRNVALTSIFSVELPGIEPSSEISLNWGNSGIDDAKRRDMTCGYAEAVDGINADRWPVVIDVRMAAGLPAVEHG